MRAADAPFLAGAEQDLPHQAGWLLARVRAERPRVHAITNTAAQVFTANLLLASGSIPSLTSASDEVAFFAAQADALLVNLGTLDEGRRAAIPVALVAAREHGRPWILDPVFVDASPPRLALARQCLAEGPAVLRCNRAEFEILSGAAASDEAVRAYARALGSVVALTGPLDHVTDGSRSVRIANGHPLMARTTAMGCAATALVAAFLAIGAAPLAAAAGALLATGVAGEIAAEKAQGPGTFPAAFLDALDGLEAEVLEARARLA